MFAFVACGLFSCSSCGDDDDTSENHPVKDDDESDDDLIDDDASDDDIDDDLDDDADDDTSIDDDSMDDDVTDDDSADDDTSDDDSTDDDSSDDDSSDDDSSEPEVVYIAATNGADVILYALSTDEQKAGEPSISGWPGDEEMLGGGAPGHNGVSMAIGAGTPIEGYEAVAQEASMPSLAIGPDGSVYVAYYDMRDPGLMLAHRSQKSWDIQRVNSRTLRCLSGDYLALNCYGGIDLAVDAQGASHIVYSDYDDLLPYYVTNKTGPWVEQNVDDHYVDSIHVAADDQGFAYIAFSQYQSIYFTTNITGDWVEELVSDPPHPSQSNYTMDLVLDRQGTPCLVYDFSATALPDGSFSLYFAEKKSGAWIATKIDEIYSYIIGINHLALAFDSQNTPHVVYDRIRLGHSWKPQDGLWRFEYVGEPYTLYLNAAFDSMDKLHTCGFTNNGGSLDYRVLEQEKWSETSLSRGEDWGYMLDSAVDENGALYVSFIDRSLNRLIMGTDASGQWNFEDVDSFGGISPNYFDGGTSIAVDENGAIHLAYPNMMLGDLKYAVNDGKGWDIQTVDNQGSMVGHQNALIVDGSDIHIFYTEALTKSLRHAVFDGASWTTEILFSNNVNVYVPIDAAIDSTGHFYVAFTWTGSSSAEYASCATDASGSWTMEYVDPNIHNYDMEYVSIAIDSNDYAYIVYDVYYYDKYLRLANNATGSWTYEDLLTSPAALLGDTSIAFDSDGFIHISYAIQETYYRHRLGYTTNKSGAWEAQQLDHSGSLGLFNSLTIDSADNIKIAFSGEGGLWLTSAPE